MMSLQGLVWLGDGVLKAAYSKQSRGIDVFIICRCNIHSEIDECSPHLIGIK